MEDIVKITNVNKFVTYKILFCAVIIYLIYIGQQHLHVASFVLEIMLHTGRTLIRTFFMNFTIVD